MRFEQLTWDQQDRFLQRLHDRLNKRWFDGRLKTLAKISIDNINKDGTDDIAAIYGDRYLVDWDRQICGYRKCILFSHEFIDDVTNRKTQRDQVYDLARLMHHEMIHQYCDENGIPDRDPDGRDHNEAWAKAAEEHGLRVLYNENGELVGEASVTAWWLAGLMRIR